MRNRNTPTASWTMLVAAIFLGIATSAPATSPRLELADQSSNGNAVKQPSSPAQTDPADPCSPVYNVGGSIKPPRATRSPNPKYAKEALNATVSGNVVVGLIVGRDGKPCNVHLVHGIGMMRLDESAVDSVRHYKFKAATQNGKPVAVNIMIEVMFNNTVIHQ